MKELPPGEISDFCRTAIIEKCHREFSEEFADQQYKFYMEKAKEWKEKKTNLQENTNKVNKILKDAINYYKDVSRDPTISELNISRYIKSQILPKLQSAHCNRFNVNDILIIVKEGKIGEES